MKVWVVSDYEYISAIFSTEEKAKLYCEINNEDYDEYEVDEYEIDEASIEMYDVYSVYINAFFEVTLVEYKEEKYDYIHEQCLNEFPQKIDLDVGNECNYLCELQIPRQLLSDQKPFTKEKVMEIAKELVGKEKERIMGGIK